MYACIYIVAKVAKLSNFTTEKGSKPIQNIP